VELFLFFPKCLYGVTRETFTLLAAWLRMDRSALVHYYGTSTGRKSNAGQPLKRPGMLY
jgi:hypothetical protein